MKVVIYNDTTHAFGRVHFGCQLVMESLHDLLSDFDIIGSVSLDDALANRADQALLARADLVIAIGEGSYHHDRRPDFVWLANHYPTALINTVYEDNSDDLSCFKYIAARESRSRDEIAKQVPCDLVPDVIFSSRYLASIQPNRGMGVVSVQHYPAMSIYKGITGFQRAVATLQAKEKVVPVIAAADSVMTCSFHGVCVAAYYGKPVSMSESNTHKMQGLAADMGLPYMSDEMACVDPDYVPMAQQRIAGMVDKLKQLTG
jgi:hypothetical protein